MKRRPLPEVLRELDKRFDCNYWIMKLHPKGRWALVLIRGEKRQSDGVETFPLCQWCGQPLRKDAPCPCTHIDGTVPGAELSSSALNDGERE